MTINEATKTKTSVATPSDRSFGMVFAGFFAIVAVWPLIHGEVIRWWAAIPAFVFLALALAIPTALHPLNRAWAAFGLLLHEIVTPIIMGAIFFLVVTPISLLMRLFGKVPMQLRFDPRASSYWIERNPPGPSGDTMRNQF
jgi:hypothetical protein